MKKLQRLELLKDFVQEAVDRGASSVEQIHQYIADLPFEALESAGLLRSDKVGLRAKHQRTIGVVYEAIRRINREVGQLISDQIENVEESKQVDELFKEAAPQPPPAAAKKKASAKKTVAKKTAAKKKPSPKKSTAKKPPAARKPAT